MKLITFSVTNYRSITRAHKINLEDITILLGKNNEGKSNIIRAISAAMFIITNPLFFEKSIYRDRYLSDRDEIYNWKRDFPIIYQNRKQGLYTIFKLEFELEAEEIVEFKNFVGSRVNGTIQIQIKVGSDNIPKIEVPKRGTRSFQKKSNRISEFIHRKISFNYIPAIRTEEEGIRIIRSNLSKELSVIEENKDYKRAVEQINNLQKIILDEIAKKIKKSLIGFIPTIKDVKLKILEESRIRSLRRDVEVIIDDGTPTNIEYKGDGIKSLVSLGLLTDRYNSKGASIIAIDEPEAHLHPGAIGELNKVIRNLKKDNQVIIATHNPQFVDISNLKNNIIVNNGKATQSKSIEEIRNVLGIKPSDNLINSKYVLIVEGENDRKALLKIFKVKSKIIYKAIEDKELSIFVLNGASKLESTLSYLKNQICECYVFIDNDIEGRTAINKVLQDKMIDNNQYNLASCTGMHDSEFEDYIKKELYMDEIKKQYGVNINIRSFDSVRKKWSDRMKNIFEIDGKLWNESIEKKLKFIVANSIENFESNIDQIFISNRTVSLDTLIQNLQNLLKNDIDNESE